MGLWQGLMRGAMAIGGAPAPSNYMAGGIKVACPHCQSDLFDEARALRNTAAMTLMNLDWADKRATTLTCRRCGLIQWFGVAPAPVEPKTKPRPRDAWEDE